MDAIQKQFILKSDNPAWQYKMKESHYFYLIEVYKEILLLKRMQYHSTSTLIVMCLTRNWYYK